MTTITKILAEFDEKIRYPSDNKLNNISDEAEMKKNDHKHFYCNDAYPESIWELDENKIKSFISSTHSHLIEEIIKEIENFDVHYGIHGEPVENPLMRTKDFKRLLITNLSILIKSK